MGPVAGMGGGGGVAWDNFFYFDPSDKDSADGTFEYLEAQAKYLAEHKLGGEFGRANALSRGADGKAIPQEIRNKALSKSPAAAAFRYHHKVKKLLDPNDLGDGYYIWMEEKD